ncbi:hypothetical protein F7P69_08725 [Cellulosimicrobium funkei]|nr:hypothetical protein [Cellulosimicrobium funkei]
MKFTDLARKAQSFANSPQGRKMIRQATDAARRFTSGRGGRPGDGSTSGPQPPRR